MSIETVASWLKAFGVPTFEGRCQFTYKGSIKINVETTENAEVIFLNARLCTLTDADDAKVLHRLLRAAYRGEQTSGAAIALDETNGVCLWLSWPVENLSAEDFEALLSGFLEAADDTLAQFGQSLAPAVESDTGMAAKSHQPGGFTV